MAKYQLVTKCAYVGTETYHEIEGDFKSEKEALEAFGGDEVANDQAQQDVEPEYYLEEVD